MGQPGGVDESPPRRAAHLPTMPALQPPEREAFAVTIAAASLRLRRQYADLVAAGRAGEAAALKAQLLCEPASAVAETARPQETH